VLGVDLWGVIHRCRAFLPILLEQDEAHIVNTSSMAALRWMKANVPPVPGPGVARTADPQP
jgi:NADP-dependent 3-hydroxy acid dehydrogenase YdfG